MMAGATTFPTAISGPTRPGAMAPAPPRVLNIASKDQRLSLKAAPRGCLLSLGHTKTSPSDRRGFTVIEILMVLVLLGILTAVAIPQFLNYGNDAKAAVTKDRLFALRSAIVGDARLVSGGRFSSAGYEIHCVGLPATLADLITQPAAGICASAYDPFNQRGWRGPYVNNSDGTYNADAWGTTIQYFTTSAPLRTLRSCGPDKSCGTGDDISITY
ncbi:MAG: prepilin-type N-terminal cleavage/methylation domain-containing protein [Proteobacteria bacterium]|nr:MAG: prepilin-type N-terminal cleavage/methylation domain-containing protein [Pseudomonadota bacterium]